MRINLVNGRILDAKNIAEGESDLSLNSSSLSSDVIHLTATGVDSPMRIYNAMLSGWMPRNVLNCRRSNRIIGHFSQLYRIASMLSCHGLSSAALSIQFN